MSGGAGHHNNKGCLLGVCLWQKVYFNETRTRTVEKNKAMGVVIGFMGKKETQPEASQKIKENAEGAEDEDVVIPPPLESEEEKSPIAMVEKFEEASLYLLLRMVHLSEKMREEHKYSCVTLEGFKIVPENMVIAVKLKRKKSKNVVALPRTVKELNAQQKNLSILQEDKQGGAAFSMYGLQDARFVTAGSSKGLTVSQNATAFAVNKWNTI